MVAAPPATPRPARGSDARAGLGPGGRGVGGAGRGGRGASRGVIRACVRLPTAFGERWVAAAVNAALPARAPPAPLPPANLAESAAEPLAKRRRTRSATSALPSGAQSVLVAPHEDPERILRNRPEAISVEAGKRWFAGHLRELRSSPTLVAAGSSGADEFIARLLENDWRSVVQSIPRVLRAEWNNASAKNLFHFRARASKPKTKTYGIQSEPSRG